MCSVSSARDSEAFADPLLIHLLLASCSLLWQNCSDYETDALPTAPRRLLVAEFLNLHAFYSGTHQAMCWQPLFCFPKGRSKVGVYSLSLAHRFGLTFWTCSLTSCQSSFLPPLGGCTESWTQSLCGRWFEEHGVLGVFMGQLGESTGWAFPVAHGWASWWTLKHRY